MDQFLFSYDVNLLQSARTFRVLPRESCLVVVDLLMCHDHYTHTPSKCYKLLLILSDLKVIMTMTLETNLH